ncbi:acyl-CoA thioesterase-1 [Prosthecobacter fusiformis]|uniref:Acyl-CoA thioesterase-1 n=1 Tax=Prosthecobacter fusiformis TaxID=48464 RepID=A0A4R7RZS9_9BACT|nr:arylesterase [Prosthecobacter fusiformis]TDU70919.1 acyl-CoA thioesterase-1 [Prosthecobacter fusiformis]
MKWLVFGLLMAASFGGKATLLAQAAGEGKKRIVILGDSITAGYGLERDEAYPALLQKKADAEGLAYEVVNAGVSGDTTAGGLRRIDWALGQRGADVLVIALGGNDGLRGVSPEQTEKNLVGIIAKARAKNPAMKILIAGMQMPDNLGPKYVESFKMIFPKVAETEKTELLPFLLEGVGGDEKLNQADRIHPTAEGQRKIAELVWAKVRGML